MTLHVNLRKEILSRYLSIIRSSFPNLACIHDLARPRWQSPRLCPYNITDIKLGSCNGYGRPAQTFLVIGRVRWHGIRLDIRKRVVSDHLYWKVKRKERWCFWVTREIKIRDVHDHRRTHELLFGTTVAPSHILHWKQAIKTHTHSLTLSLSLLRVCALLAIP